MGKSIIEVRDLGKRYQLGHLGARSLRDEAAGLWRRLFGPGQTSGADPEKTDLGRGWSKRPQTTFWALKGVTFDVQPGEVVGVIGRNGAGKSTLLKILSRITEPTEGEVVMRGRVASLLEVGTGFHPELSGRENIYLNGAILGLSKAEIDRKLDEIVAFAEVEKFLETPVRRYSSGMYVRLAFAVAAHLEPDILIVDEVLAVGDAQFQKKCLGKMQDVGRHGRTILLVSHNMGMITSLCQSAILLEAGKLASAGPASRLSLEYFTRKGAAPNEVDFTGPETRVPGDEDASLRRARVEKVDGQPTYEVEMAEPFQVRMEYEVRRDAPEAPTAAFHFFDSRGECVFVSTGSEKVGAKRAAGRYEAVCRVPGSLLNNGVYYVGLGLTFRHMLPYRCFYERDALSLVVKEPLERTLEERGEFGGGYPGVVRPNLDWEIRALGGG